jgi:predicted aspartyl protease
LFKFLVSGSSNDGADSKKKIKNPPKSSLILLTTLVNNYQIKILIDTGATTTFVNERILHRMQRPRFIHKNSYSFVLADGVAPFQVLGTCELSIQFNGIATTIQAHIARNLCADMILGMDYINKYNLNIDIKRQNISIEYSNRILTMHVDKDYEVQRIPVTSAKQTYIPPYSNRSTQVSIPLSSVYSPFVPNSHLRYNTSLMITHTRLNFQNYCSNVTFSNDSPHPQFIRKGVCVGFLLFKSIPKVSQLSPYSLHKSFEVAGYSGKTSVPFDFHVDDLARGQKSFGVTGSSDKTPVSRDFDLDQFDNCPKSLGVTRCFGMTPVVCDFNKDNIVYDKTHKYPNTQIFCNTIQSLNPAVETDIRALVQKINNKQQQDQLYSLLVRFHRIFDVTKHNIANTPINHVINTVPHSPPACRPYPQPDKEEAMYKLIQEFLQAKTLLTKQVVEILKSGCSTSLVMYHLL